MSTAKDTAIRIDGVGKHFGDVWVLRDVSFDVAPGQVLGLVGENGSGKSTLVKILTGYHTPDAGSVQIAGEDVSFPVGTKDHGISVVHQDLGLIDDLSVSDNIGVTSRFGARRLRPISFRSERRVCAGLLRAFGVDVSPDTLVSELSPAERSAVAIVRVSRAIGERAANHLLILDEPTAYLGRRDAERVLRLARTAASRGAAVIFISHHLPEVIAVSDHIVVLRDGELVAQFPSAGVDQGMVVEHMLGRKLDRFYPEPPETGQERPVLRLDQVRGSQVRNVSLEVRAGEVLGVTGLVGSGHEELPYLIAGSRPRMAGTIEVDGVPVDVKKPSHMIRRGVALVPGNRQRDGAWLDGTAQENISLPRLDSFFRWPSLRSRMERGDARTLMERYDVRPRQTGKPFRNFSGGNQQKMMVAKWMSTAPDVIMLDEPTQGVDAGARRDILDTLADAAREGTAVVIFSNDFEQIAQVCDRVVVFVSGEVAAVLAAAEATEHGIVALAQQGSFDAAEDSTAV